MKRASANGDVGGDMSVVAGGCVSRAWPVSQQCLTKQSVRTLGAFYFPILHSVFIKTYYVFEIGRSSYSL